jgi:glutamate N-acetyltransferase / amino-acid N-acetyltransferase
VTEARGTITAPLGFRAAGLAAGIKANGKDDLMLLVADATCNAAAVFTQNLATAAPVLVSRDHVAGGRARAIVVNAGCANAATGEGGLADAREMASLTARALGGEGREVLVCSTGVIGVRLPMEKLRAGIPRAAQALARENGAAAARAIMTTDQYPKESLADFAAGGKTARVGGMGKGAGMIAPNMATMLGFVTTDAHVESSLLRRALADAVADSFNRITVDGDTSTNDTVIVMASGASGVRIETAGADYEGFRAALAKVLRDIALLIVRDGEGATRIAEVRVEGAATAADADRIARTVAESPLVKTALNGADANWGRVLGAVGRAGVALDIDTVDIHIGDVFVCEGGAGRSYDEAAATKAMHEDPVRIRVRLRAGGGSSWMWTSDLSHGYVDVNGSYRS